MDYKTLPSQEFKVYPYRFVVVGLFALIQMMTSVLLATLNPIAEYLTEVYDQEPIVINLGALLFALMHPIFTFPAAYVIDTYGARTGIIVGSVLGIVGVSVRLLVN
jgi:MFS transporter, FLVCR family, feline leukemia virus subgroup C receptor-related protein